MNIQLILTSYIISNYRMIQHTISEDQILMQIMPGRHEMPTNPSHATLTIESQNPKTNIREVQRYVMSLVQVPFLLIFLQIFCLCQQCVNVDDI